MKIFVSICSYRDPLLHFTLESLISSKSALTEVTYGIFEQIVYEDSLEAKYPELVSRPDVKYKRIDPQFSEGVGWARNLNALQMTDEDFYYQIDSHMLFDQNWDRELISDYRLGVSRYKTHRIIITSNCKNFTMVDGTPCLDHNRMVATETKFYQFGPDYKLYAHGEHIPPTELPMPTYHVFAGNMFTHADWIANVGINPKIFFHGEEQMFALSSFKMGYVMLSGRSISSYHYFDSNTHSSKQEINPVVSAEVLKKRNEDSDAEFIRYVRSLDDNTLKQFAILSGVDYINRKIERRAHTCTITPSIPNDWTIPDKVIE